MTNKSNRGGGNYIAGYPLVSVWSYGRAAKLKEDFEGVAIQMRPQADIDAEAEFLRNAK